MCDVGYGMKDSVGGYDISGASGHKTYQHLEVYRIAHRLGVAIHGFSLRLPKFELYEPGSQLRRSSKSVSANIVEGFCRRRYKAEFIRFLVFAHASCNEAIEWVEYVRDCHPDLREGAKGILDKLDELGRKLNRFILAVGRDHKS
jgi:four helix bundle protein